MNYRPNETYTPLVATWRWRGFAVCALLTLTVAAVAGCSSQPFGGTVPGDGTAQAAPLGGEIVAPGVVHRAIPTSNSNGLDIIDIDLKTARVRVAVGAEDVRSEGGTIVANGFLPSQWISKGAIAAVNGGYFGRQEGTSKEIVGLLVQNGRVRRAAPALVGHGGNGLPAGRYLRSAFGVMPDGAPVIAWVATDPGKPQRLRAYNSTSPGVGRPWRPRDAIGCGPTLIAGGRRVVTDRKERLVSEGPLPRTFVAYDSVNGAPRHVIVGIASGASFDDLSQYLVNYFPKYDHTKAWSAMCFDGGASTQLSYRTGDNSYSPRDTGVTVPDCLLIMPGRR